MRPLILDLPNGRELANELGFAIEQMMAISVELIGGAEWLAASAMQQQAFQKWREYLQLMADGRVRVEPLEVASIYGPLVDEPEHVDRRCYRDDHGFSSRRAHQQTGPSSVS